MAIIASISHNGESLPVEVTNVYYSETRRCKVASVHALKGEPFPQATHGGWAYSASTTVRVECLSNVHQDPPEPATPTLLDLAIAAERAQWPAGEVVYLWGDKKCGAFLKEQGGTVNLCLIGYGPSCSIFWLDWTLPGWQVYENVTDRYQKWVQKYQESRAR